MCSTQLLQNDLLSRATFDVKDHYYDISLVNWFTAHHPVQPPAGNLAMKQRSWNQTTVKKTYSSLLVIQTTQYYRARMNVTSAFFSGDWLHALSISLCGLCLDNDALRIEIGLYIRSHFCDPRECTFGSLVDCKGSHGLCYRRSSVKSARLSFINDLVFYALCCAGISSIKEPPDLSRSDKKRPDGLTLTWQARKNAIWDVTVTHTLAMLYVNSASVTATNAAKLATARKGDKIRRYGIKKYFYPNGD